RLLWIFPTKSSFCLIFVFLLAFKSTVFMEFSLNKGNGYAKIESYDDETTSQLAEVYERSLRLLGEDPTREGLEKTPLRVAKAMQFLTQGYNMKPEEIIRSAMFREDYQQMV